MRRKIAFGNDALISRKITLEACPALLNTTEPSVTCQNHHLQVSFGSNVPIISSDSGAPLKGKKTMVIPSSKGIESKRVIDFATNILIPYMEGGRLSDIFNTAPRYQSTMLRYPLYVTVATRLVEAVRFLHSHNVAHLAIEPSSIICSSIDCDEIMLTDFSRATFGASPSPFANELMQDAVRFVSYEEPAKDEEGMPSEAKPNAKIIQEFKEYGMEDAKHPSWSTKTLVDWYAVGGTFFSILTRSRYAPDELSQSKGPSISRELAEYIFKTFEDRKVLDRVQSDRDTSATLKRVRNSVTEGLILIEGLLHPNRDQRISLDPVDGEDDRATQARKSLRASHALMSALQVEVNRPGKQRKSTCASFMEQTIKKSDVLHGIDVHDKGSLPSFMREFC